MSLLYLKMDSTYSTVETVSLLYVTVAMSGSDEQPEYKIERLNQLAFPRDANPKCEITGGRAAVQLITQHLTLL